MVMLKARHARSLFVFDTLHERESGLTDLSLSLPPPHPLRAQALSTALHALSGDPEVLTRGITYSGAQGSEHHRQLLARWLGRLGMALAADELLVTQGGHHDRVMPGPVASRLTRSDLSSAVALPAP
ncbi:hypothetical protein [Halomonas sp. BC1]|uniref:hypothetical protein n=1 Tax=Halomonas sp. BC1 TaxID=1670448 RepID=UPI001594435B|nr:hypothetical protein [Halomonas sp. BC1]